MTPLQKIRSSFTTQLTLWVAGLVTVISVLVIVLLALFSKEIIHDETVDATLQALENTALQIDNRLHQSEMAARMEKRTVTVDSGSIERLINENGYLAKLQHSLPNATLEVISRSAEGRLLPTGSKSFKHQTSNFKHQNSNFKHQTSNFKHQTSNFKHQAGSVGESGYRVEDIDGEENYIFYHSLRGGAYSLTVVCPAQDIYGKYARMQWLLLLGGVVGVLLLLYVLYIVVGRHLRPLHRLADAAQSIAQNNLDTPIPDTRHQDETGRLQNSLSKMQQSLKAYIAEMRHKQDTLSRQNAELNAAYAEVEGYESLKTNFLRDMTARMAEPVDSLCQQTDRICQNYAKMTKAEMVRLQLGIMQNTETVTSLLDQLASEKFSENSEGLRIADVPLAGQTADSYLTSVASEQATAPADSSLIYGEQCRTTLHSSLFTLHSSLIRNIRQRLSLRLGLLIVLIITVAFSLVFDFLFYRCKHYIQLAAIDYATQLLDNTAERISGIMDETELVTNFMALTTPSHLTPDSLLAFTHRTVNDYSFLTGFAISMEPDFFPEMGRYFSAYSLRQGDSIITVREGPFEYFDAVWYKTPRSLGTSCWIDAFDDYNEGTLSSPDILTSYCCPMRNADGHYIGSITASLTLKWLSKAFTAIQPYPNSSAIMIGRDGTYLVHPDTAKLFRETIFSDAAPEARRDIEIMGRAMLAGRSGMTQTIVDGHDAFIFYRPLQRTGWSIAIVCPKSDVFARYNRLLAFVWAVIIVGLILLLVVCYQTVRRAILPLRQLDEQAQRIASGNFDEALPPSIRHDSVGRLQNSFILMQHSLAQLVNDIRSVNSKLQQRNDELTTAYRLKLEANRKKAAFIQNMYHEIRTPLNIICGFTEVLTTSLHDLPADELTNITERMRQSAADISRLARELSQVAMNS